MLNFSEKINNFIGLALGFLLVALSALALYTILLVQDFRAIALKSRSILENSDIESTLRNINNTSKAIEQSSLAIKEVSQTQQELLTNEKTQRAIGLALRSGDDLNRTIKKINVALDQVNNSTIPKINNTLDNASTVINTSNKIIIRLADKTELILEDTDQAIKDLRDLLQDPNIQKTLAGVADFATASGKTAHTVEATAEEIRAAIPELVASVKSVGSNADLSSQEVLTFLTGLNKPLTRKQKIFKFLLEAIVKSSPALLRR